jgi:uncharacterized protein (DUF952 family)
MGATFLRDSVKHRLIRRFVPDAPGPAGMHAIVFKVPSDLIFHICSRDAWIEAVQQGRYDGSELDRRDGFIHFSAPGRIRETASLHLRGVDGLVLVGVDAASLGPALRWETSRDGIAFPHLYGPLPVDDTVSVWDLPLGSDGFHIFPSFLKGE